MTNNTESLKETSLRVNYIWLYVKDTQKSIRFYKDTLGLRLVESFPDGALLNAGGIQLGIHREEADRRSQPGGTSIILGTREIRKSYEELKRRGVEFLTPIKKEDYGEIASFRDPDGYLLELWQPL